MSDRCDADVFKDGVPLLLADTGEAGGAKLFEAWVQDVASDSDQRVDWHYSGGIAQVLVLGDHAKATEAAKGLEPSLPKQIRIMRWCAPAEGGLYRKGVTEVPEGTIAGVSDPIAGRSVFIRSGVR